MMTEPRSDYPYVIGLTGGALVFTVVGWIGIGAFCAFAAWTSIPSGEFRIAALVMIVIAVAVIIFLGVKDHKIFRDDAIVFVGAFGSTTYELQDLSGYRRFSTNVPKVERWQFFSRDGEPLRFVVIIPGALPVIDAWFLKLPDLDQPRDHSLGR